MQILFTYEFSTDEELDNCLSELERNFGGRGEGGYQSYMAMEIDITENCPDIECAKEICEEWGVLTKVNGSTFQAG